MEKRPKCLCPFCEQEIFYANLICRPCGVEFLICSCGELVSKTKDHCPQCGKKIQEKKGEKIDK